MNQFRLYWKIRKGHACFVKYHKAENIDNRNGYSDKDATTIMEGKKKIQKSIEQWRGKKKLGQSTLN